MDHIQCHFGIRLIVNINISSTAGSGIGIAVDDTVENVQRGIFTVLQIKSGTGMGIERITAVAGNSRVNHINGERICLQINRSAIIQRVVAGNSGVNDIQLHRTVRINTDRSAIAVESFTAGNGNIFQTQ